MAKATGIQITGSTVRISEAEGSQKNLKLRSYIEVPIDPAEERINGLTKAIREALKSTKASREHVIVGIPVRDCIIRDITIPFTDVDQIKKVIKFESEPHLHSCSIDDVVVGFHKAEEIGKRSSVIVVAARKERIAESLKALENCGIDPLSVDIDAAGLYGLTTNIDLLEGQKSFVICEVGYSSTLFIMVADGDFRIVRSVRMGLDSITSKVSQDLELEASDAREKTLSIILDDSNGDDDLLVPVKNESTEETRKSSNELERDIIRQRQSDLVTRLEQEMFRSLNHVNLEGDLEGIYLTGPGSLLPQIEEELSARMSIPVAKLGVLDRVEHNIPAKDVRATNAGVAVSLGLATKHIGSDPMGMEFRKEEFVFTKKFDKLRSALIGMVILMTFVNAIWFTLEKAMKDDHDKVERSFAGRASEQFTKISDPRVFSANDRQYADLSDQDLKKLRSQEADLSGLERVNFIGRTIKDMRTKLRKAYDLGSAKAGSKSASDFPSALERLEQVTTAIVATGIKGYAINQIKANIKAVQMNLTLPEIAEIEGVNQGVIDQLAIIEEQLKKSVPGFTVLVYTKHPKRTDGRGYDIPGLTVEFEKESK